MKNKKLLDYVVDCISDFNVSNASNNNPSKSIVENIVKNTNKFLNQ